MNKPASLIEDPEVFKLLSQRDLSKPAGMLNQLKFRPQALYEPDSGETPCTGVEAFKRYTVLVRPIVEAMGGKVILTGAISLIGKQDEWDSSFVVRYEHASDLVNMTSDPAYLRAVHHRTAALSDSRLLMMDFDVLSFD